MKPLFSIPLDEIHIDEKLNFIEEPVEIMDREVKCLKQSRIPIVKVRWNSRRGPEYTMGTEDQMKREISKVQDKGYIGVHYFGSHALKICWNDPRDFAKTVKAISLPQNVPSTFDRHLIELENQVRRLIEAHLAPTQPTQVNKITTSCKICSGPHDTQYCMEDPEQAFVEYASLRNDEAGGKWYTFKPGQNNLGDTYNPS
ncbi:hypothetical protein Tco_0360024 [Tanacetum coccineum]